MTTSILAENSQYQVVHSNLFGNLTILIHHDQSIWFIAKEVAEKLGYTNTSKAISDHCKGGNETLLPSNGGFQRTKIIPENDIYRLILRSKLPIARQFEAWIMDEVLPSIRKTGSYKHQTLPKQLMPQKNRAGGNASLLRIGLTAVDCMEISKNTKQILKAHLLYAHTGLPINLMLPVTKHMISASEIAKTLGISPQKVGRVINQLNIKTNPELYECRLSKSRTSNKEVEQFFYDPSIVDMIKTELTEK